MKKIMFLVLALSVMAMGDAAANLRKPNNGCGPKKVKIELNVNCHGHNHGVGPDYRWDAPRHKGCKVCDRHFKAHGPRDRRLRCPECGSRSPRPEPRPNFGPGCRPAPRYRR